MKKINSKLLKGGSASIKEETYINHYADILAMEKTLIENLRKPRELVVDFVDVSAGSIQVYVSKRDNKIISIYENLEYDFSNAKSVIEKLVSRWNNMTEKEIDQMIKFYEDGFTYGWD